MIEIFVNLLSFGLLGVVAGAVGNLYFGIINKYVPDPLNFFNATPIHYAIAALIIAFPLYFWAEVFWFRKFSKNPEKTESKISKWLTYIILFIATGAIIGDLIAVIFNYLQGELSLRFFLKALTILAIAGMGFWFYFLERKKIQYKKAVSPLYFKLIGGLMILIVVVGIVFGFLAAGTPSKARLQRLDIETADNLSQISYAINDFAASQNKLPAGISQLKNNPTYAGYFYGISEEGIKNYEYRITDKTHYQLCGTFNLATTDLNTMPVGQIWSQHEAGKVCKTLTSNLSNVLKMPQ